VNNVTRIIPPEETETAAWPPLEVCHQPIAVLISGGIDSAVMLADAATRFPCVHPVYIRTGLIWEGAELAHLHRFLQALSLPSVIAPLVILDQPVGDLYGDHWSRSGRGVPAAGTPDEEVYLPGRNVLLLTKALLWCHLHQVSLLALAPLAANPFPDATPAFFAAMASVVGQAVRDHFTIVRPYSHWHKTQVIRRGRELPLHLTFSCIQPVAEGRHCGRCSKCYERATAFRAAGLPDPTDYAQPVPLMQDGESGHVSCQS
jgi:7-cyano-7-deazaguanine synthase